MDRNGKNKLLKNKHNYSKILLLIIVLYLLAFLKLPFVIERPGGFINLFERVEGYNKNKKESINMVYVIEQRATILTYFIGLINDKWSVYSVDDFVASNETYAEMEIKSKNMLKESVGDAFISAYNLLDISYSVKNEKVFIGMVEERAKTSLKIGDRLISMNGILLKNISHLTELTERFKVGNTVYFEVENIELKNKNREAIFIDYDGLKLIGLVLTETKDVISSNSFSFDFKERESGPSGGLMMSLFVYNKFSKEDIIDGRVIAGTGTINRHGFVGPIGGIKHKTIAASKEKADVFFVPIGINYEEAIKTKKNYDLKINIVSVEKLDDVIDYLKK